MKLNPFAVVFFKKYGLLLAILLLAVALRGALIPYGLPLLFHEDEPIYYRRALQFGFGNFDPHYFKKPTFFLYFYYGFYYLSYWFSQAPNWKSFYQGFWQDPTAVATLGRSITVCFSVLSVWLSYRLGKRTLSKAVGLAAAFLLAIDFTHVKYSPIVISDIPALFYILLTAWFACSVYEKGRWRDYLLCGTSIALAMSFKYNAFAVFFLMAAHGLQVWNQKAERSWTRLLLSGRLWGALGAIVGVFLLLNPFVILNFSTFLADLNLERQHMLLRSPQITTRSYSFMVGFDNIFFQILPKALGWPLYLLGLVGMVAAFWRLRKLTPEEKALRQRAWLLLSFPIGFLIVVSQFRLVNAKYLLPVIPFWFIMAAFCLQRGLSWLQHQKPQLLVGWRAPVLYGALVLGFSYPMLKDTLAHVSVYRHPDTRTQARLYVESHVASGSLVYTEPETVPLIGPLSEGKTAMVVETATGFQGSHLWSQGPVEEAYLGTAKPQYAILLLKPRRGPGGSKVLPYPPGYYAYLQTHYRVAYIFSPYARQIDSTTFPETIDFMVLYQQIKGKAQQVRPGPVLLLLKQTP